MKHKIEFYGFDKDGLRLQTWAFEGTEANLEEAVFIKRLARGDFNRVAIYNTRTGHTTIFTREVNEQRNNSES